jgi:hypothetical protein
MRWLASALVIAFGLSSVASAQVFKPKGKKSDVSVDKKPAKKSTKAKSTKSKKKKKSAAAERSRPDDLTPDAPSKSEDSDFVKITDDEEIE